MRDGDYIIGVPTGRGEAFVLSCRKSVLVGQKVADHLAQHHEFRKLGWFSEIPVRAQRVHFLAVAARIRGCNDHDKRVFAARTGAKPAQYVPSLVAGHVDVKEYEVRARHGEAGLHFLEKSHHLLAVVGNVNLRFDARFLERPPDQEDI